MACGKGRVYKIFLQFDGYPIWIPCMKISETVRIELGSILLDLYNSFAIGWGAKKTSRQPEDRRAQERRCKRISRG